jgi:hypothetical protein
VWVTKESAKSEIKDLPGDRVLKLNVKHITKPVGGPNNGNIRRLQIECEVCKEVYKSSGDLKAHYRSTKHGKFNCSFCKASFITRGSLKQHTQVRHREDIINSILNATATSSQPEQNSDHTKTEQSQATKENTDKNSNTEVINTAHDSSSSTNTPVKEERSDPVKVPAAASNERIEPKESTPNKNNNTISDDNKKESPSSKNEVKTVTIKIADLRRKLNSMTTKK